MSSVGRRCAHTAGRSGLPKIAQALSGVSWTQRTPAGLPCGIPGMGLEIDGAMQQAPQRGRHCIEASGDVARGGQRRARGR